MKITYGRGDELEVRFRNITLKRFLFIPEMGTNLISCSVLCRDGFRINFSDTQSVGIKSGLIMLQASRCNGVYRVACQPLSHLSGFAAHAEQSSLNDDDLKLWHERLAHANFQSIERLARECLVNGITIKSKEAYPKHCDSCIKGKQTRETLRANYHRSLEKGAVIHTDVCGPISCSSFGGARYFISFIDEYSGYMVIIPIARKSDVLKEFKYFHSWIERRWGCTVKKVHSDNGGEFVSSKDHLLQHDIEQSMTPSYSPNLNGIAERANRTIVEAARCMLEHSNLPRKFWAQAVVHAIRIRNMFFAPRTHSDTSYGLMTGTKPDASKLKFFWCLAWHHIPKELRRKLDSKSDRGIVLGCYENSQFKLWVPPRNVAIISRDVTIVEDVFPAAEGGWDSSEQSLLDDIQTSDREPKVAAKPQPRTPLPAQSGSQEGEIQNVNAENKGSRDDRSDEESDENNYLNVNELTHYPSIEGSVDQDDAIIEEDRNANPMVTGQDNDKESSHRRYPQRDRRSAVFFQPGSANVVLKNTEKSTLEPETVAQTLNMPDSKEWKGAILSELKSSEDHET